MLADSRVVSMLTLSTFGSRIEHRTYNIYMVWVLQFLIKGVIGGCYPERGELALLTVLSCGSRIPLTLLQTLGYIFQRHGLPSFGRLSRKLSNSSAPIIGRLSTFLVPWRRKTA